MRIYQSCFEATREVERDLFEMGIEVSVATMQDKVVIDNPDFLTKELSPYSFQLIPGAGADKNKMLEYLNIPLDWCEAEFRERISPERINPGEAWKLRAGVWGEFLHDGKFAYTYNERFRDQLPKVIEELKAHNTSRQVIMTIYDDYFMKSWGGVSRIPCSLHYQFLVRKDPMTNSMALDLIYVMRSNDFLTFWGSDTWFALKLQEYVAEELGIIPGKYTYFTGSLHAYYKDLKVRGIF